MQSLWHYVSITASRHCSALQWHVLCFCFAYGEAAHEHTTNLQAFPGILHDFLPQPFGYAAHAALPAVEERPLLLLRGGLDRRRGARSWRKLV